MILFYVIRSIQMLVMVLLGFRLLTQAYEMRWKHLAAKIVLGFILLALTGSFIIQAYWAKVSDMEYLYALLITFICMLVFYRIPFLHAFVSSMLYWLQLLLLNWTLLVISALTKNETIKGYNETFHLYSWIHILGMCLVILLILFLYKKRRNKPLIALYKKKHYIYLALLLLAEYLLLSNLMIIEDFYLSAHWGTVLIALGGIIIVISVGIAFVLYHSRLKKKIYARLTEVQYDMLERQYDYIQENYDAKRREVHNAIHQFNHLKECLEADKVEEAKEYLDELLLNIEKGVKPLETAISSLDFIIDYKRSEARKYNIEIETDLSVLFCPLSRNEACILLGNLLDNAIEAVQGLMASQRKVSLKIKTVNELFLLEMQNPYIGERKLYDGKYVTTKENPNIHGLGLESCKRIVERYDGMFQIKDDGEQFRVELAIFQDGKLK